jgi:hypothetical protein
MTDVWSSVGWFRSGSLVREEKKLRDEMDRHYRERRFHDVILTHDIWLGPLMDQMTNLGDRRRSRALEIRQDAAAALEIEAKGIEALEHGWIVDHEEILRLRPEGLWPLPVPRRYRPHETLRGKPEVRVLRFHEDHVTFIYTGKDGKKRLVDYPYSRPGRDTVDWDVPRQEAIVDLWERRWYRMTSVEEQGHGSFGDLTDDIHRWRARITWPDLRERLDALWEEMRPAWPSPEHVALLDMDTAYRKGRYEEVIRIFHGNLVPRAIGMVIRDPDSRRVAEDILAKGEVLAEDAGATREVARFRLELLPSGMIVNHATGRGKVCTPGESIEAIPDLVVVEASAGLVRCRYRDHYVLDLFSP